VEAVDVAIITIITYESLIPCWSSLTLLCY